MFADNLKYLRTLNNISQGRLSEEIGIPRTTLGDYERSKTEPNIATILKLADYFKVSLDKMLKDNLSHDTHIVSSSDQLKVLAITIDSNNNQNIELVTTKAEAGYLESFANPEYIKDLPKMSIPGLNDKSYRAFIISGDSMLPMESGSIIITSYVEGINDIKDNHTYIIVSKREGLVYKRIQNSNKEKRLLLLSDNMAYLPYEIDYEDVDEIWAYESHIAFNDSKSMMDHMIEEKLNDIQKKVTEIHAKIH
jgi:transcriptional regulator with XRE-family HTH domain